MGAGLSRRLVSLRIPQTMALVMLSPIAVGQAIPVVASTTSCTASTFAAGGFNSAAIFSGKLYMWGNNSDAELGIGVSGGPGRPSPLPVVTTTGLVNPTATWTSGVSSFAVDPSGQLWGWGDNFFGELGNPSSRVFTSPAQITGPTQAVSVSSGGFATLAATPDGTVWGWGMSPDGELGFVNSTPQMTPIVLPGLSNIAQVSNGPFTSVALKADGTVYGAGQNIGGALGLGSGVSQSTTFVPLPGLSNVVEIASNETGFFSAFVVAVDQSGHVFASGNNRDGEMGNGSVSSTPQFTFAQVPNFDSVVAVAAGDRQVLALKSDGTVWAWGGNATGQLGDGTLDDSATPVQVSFPAGTELVSIAAGFSHSMARDSDGNLWSWGSNSSGELGIGTVGGFRTVPVEVACPPPATYLPSINGYRFDNPGGDLVTVPSFDQMASYYPSSGFEIFYPFSHKETFLADWFNNNWFKSTYTGGLCYGMAASDQFLYNTFPDKSAVTLYPDFPGLPGTFPGALGASPSPADTNIEQFIDRYHSRQLAAAGVVTGIRSWKNTELTGGNRAALDAIATAVASGKTEWVGLGPSSAVLTETPNPLANKDRFWFLYNESHALLAYSVDKSLGRIRVYDPNFPSDDKAYIQIVDSPINSGGGIKVIHHGDPSDPNSVSYGGGINPNGTDLGQSGEWTLMPLRQEAFTDNGIAPPYDNRHWAIDLVNPIALIAGAKLSDLLGDPIFIMRNTISTDPTHSELLPPGTGLAGSITAARPGARTSQASGSHAVDVTQTDAAATGTTHQVAISPDASHVNLSNSSSIQQYTITLGADFLTSSFGRSFTVSGINLVPGGTVDVSADPSYSALTLSASAMAGQQANLQLSQLGQGAGSTSVTVTIPATGSHGVVFVGDWTALAQSLVFEIVTGPNGQVTGLVLQDNAGQRQQVTTQLLQSIQAAINLVADIGIRNSLQAKLDNASKQIGKGDPGTAANVLDALSNEVAAQSGLAIPTELASSLSASLSELIGLLRASSV